MYKKCVILLSIWVTLNAAPYIYIYIYTYIYTYIHTTVKNNKMCNPSGLEGITSLGRVQNIYRNVPRCCCCFFRFLLFLFFFFSLLLLLLLSSSLFCCCCCFYTYISYVVHNRKDFVKINLGLIVIKTRWKRQLDTTSLQLCHVRPSASLISWKKSNSLWLFFRGAQQ